MIESPKKQTKRMLSIRSKTPKPACFIYRLIIWVRMIVIDAVSAYCIGGLPPKNFIGVHFMASLGIYIYS